MLKPLIKLFRSEPAAPGAHVPEGTRYYAIGDIHGRLDLFEAMIEAIEQDDKTASPAETTIILLGDLIDRGPDSAGVIRRTREWKGNRTIRIIAGNHEEMFLASFEDLDKLRAFNKFGGRETILSYGVDKQDYNRTSLEELQVLMRNTVPEEDRAFIGSFEDCIIAGDYLFVHAGINPDNPVNEQKQQDMRWIRDRFLRHTGQFSHVVVHGHTIMENTERRINRIGIDTGAYRTGRLTTLVLEGGNCRTIQTVDHDGVIATEHQDALAFSR
ncbi:MAG: metallophosphoesterase family protein [Sphingomonadaceae bacterium]